MSEAPMMIKSCPGADGLACIDGWLYIHLVVGMAFGVNRRCPTCFLDTRHPIKPGRLSCGCPVGSGKDCPKLGCPGKREELAR